MHCVPTFAALPSISLSAGGLHAVTCKLSSHQVTLCICIVCTMAPALLHLAILPVALRTHRTLMQQLGCPESSLASPPGSPAAAQGHLGPLR